MIRMTGKDITLRSKATSTKTRIETLTIEYMRHTIFRSKATSTKTRIETSVILTR